MQLQLWGDEVEVDIMHNQVVGGKFIVQLFDVSVCMYVCMCASM